MEYKNTERKMRGGIPITGILAALITLTAVLWSSGAPLWIGWRVYSEQVLIAALAFAMAVAFITSQSGPLWWSRLAAIASLCFGAWLTVRFPLCLRMCFTIPPKR